MISQSRFYEKETKTEEKHEPPKLRLNDLRYEAIIKYIKALPKKETIVDFGAGEGSCLFSWDLLRGVKEILSVEPSNKARLKALERFEQAKEKRGYVEPNHSQDRYFIMMTG